MNENLHKGEQGKFLKDIRWRKKNSKTQFLNGVETVNGFGYVKASFTDTFEDTNEIRISIAKKCSNLIYKHPEN